MKVLEEINRVVDVPIKFIHVIRNPFDTIASNALRRKKSRDIHRREEVKAKEVININKVIIPEVYI